VSGSRRGPPRNALGRLTEVLGLAHDPATSGRLDSGAAAEAVARAHWTWVSCARYMTSIPVRELLGALDAADKWLIATGHSHWRAAALLERAGVHRDLSEYDTAVGYAEEALAVALQAVQLAESLGDGALCTSLGALAAACRADGDLEAAWQAATRHLEAAGRIGGRYKPYYAARTAADIALDRGDLAAAREFLADLDEHARAMDTATGLTAYTADVARRHQRLTELGPRP
jgi:hypothetical protein